MEAFCGHEPREEEAKAALREFFDSVLELDGQRELRRIYEGFCCERVRCACSFRTSTPSLEPADVRLPN